VAATKRDEVDEIVGRLDDEERAGQPAEKVAASWRFAGIVDADEVKAWTEVGVFDGHRAGLLKLAGVEASQIAALVDARKLGLAFAMGELSVREVCNLIALFEGAALGTADPKSSFVRATRPARARDERSDDEGKGAKLFA
jgi:hypothetical protein